MRFISFAMIRLSSAIHWLQEVDKNITRVVPKVMSNFYLHVNWEQQMKESAVVDGTSSCYPWVSCDINSLHHMTSIPPNKMANNDMSFRQRAVIEFLVKEEIPAAEIHQRLQCAYGSVCMGANSVQRWVKLFKTGKMEAIQKAVCQCLRMAGTEFYRRGNFKLPERWEKCVQRSGDYVEK